jgi:heme oxygenase
MSQPTDRNAPIKQPASVAAPDVLAALRDATHSRHADLDQRMPLAKAGATLTDYGAHLRLLRAWLAPISRWNAAFNDGPQDASVLPPVERLALIDADLDHPGVGAAGLASTVAALSASAASATVAAWPQPATPADAAYRWGVAYVVEGSQLGGAVLYRQLAASLAPHPLRYLRGAEAGPGPRWQLFLRALRGHVRSPDAIAAACRGACDTFDAIIALLPPDAAHA